MDIDSLLATYPRARPPLSQAHQAAYEREYRLNREGRSVATSISKKLESWMHRKVAAKRDAAVVLELGAGTLNHLRYEAAGAYDIVEPFDALFRASPHLSRVRQVYRDVAHVPGDMRYDRIFSVAVLEHLEALPEVVARCGLLLKEGGMFQAGIPSEGGLLWGLSWRISTGLGYRLRTGLSYKALMRHEHVNSASEIKMILNHFFERTSVEYFPMPAHHASFYTYLEATKPRRASCRAFLVGRDAAA